jgi:hypothetical protein
MAAIFLLRKPDVGDLSRRVADFLDPKHVAGRSEQTYTT